MDVTVVILKQGQQYNGTITYRCNTFNIVGRAVLHLSILLGFNALQATK